MSEFAQCFSDAHGLKLKTAFAETLTHLLHPISKVYTIEAVDWPPADVYARLRKMN